MLRFTRNKLASVHHTSDGRLYVHGVLEDDIYGMAVELQVSLPELEILAIDGHWSRMENAQCIRALPILQQAVGLRIDPDIVQKLQKGVGRKACRHFADLIIECCEAARDAVQCIPAADRNATKPGMDVEDYFGKTEDSAPPAASGAGEPGQDAAAGIASAPCPDTAALRDASTGIVIDLHVHSAPASPCSSVSVAALIEEARAVGLDGIVLTDHNHRWSRQEVEAMRRRYDFLVLRGNEVTTDQGDILVLGLEDDIDGVIRLQDLREKVLRAQGFMIAAHPFRGFLTFGIGYLGLTPKKAGRRPVFQYVDAVEVMNSRVSEKENRFAARVAESLGLPVIGGSDAHKQGEVGCYATRFAGPIRDERDLIAALKSGRFSPVAFRQK